MWLVYSPERSLSCGSCWYPLTISPNGSKQCHSQKSLINKLSSFFHRTSCVTSNSPTPLSPTTEQTLPASKWPTYAQSIRSPTDFPLHTMLKAMIKTRSTIAPSSTVCAKAWIEQRANGLRNSSGCSGPTGPPSASLRAKRRSHWQMNGSDNRDQC